MREAREGGREGREGGGGEGGKEGRGRARGRGKGRGGEGKGDVGTYHRKSLQWETRLESMQKLIETKQENCRGESEDVPVERRRSQQGSRRGGVVHGIV